MKFAFFILGAATLVRASLLPECPQGIGAFQKSVHAKVTKDCMMCHNGSNPNAPPFATTDVVQSYYRLLNYTHFQQPSLSTLVIRAGNGHCMLENCNTQSGTEMLAQVNVWWNEGQKDCPLDGHYFTTEMAIPADLPVHPAGFKKLEWDLTPFGIEFAGYQFQIEAQYWAKESPTNPGAYRFRLPRISVGKKSVHIKDLRVLVNRRTDPLANAFTFIDQITSPQVPTNDRAMVYPMLSSDTIITNQITGEDKVSLSFDAFEKATPVECIAPEYFQDNIIPYFQQAACAKCHGNGQGTSFDVFSSSGDPKLLCRTVRERMNLNYPMQSSFLKTVTQGKFQHPDSIANPSRFEEDLLKWVDKERISCSSPRS